MIDILFLAKGRPEFTSDSWFALFRNTDWSKVKSVHVYTDGDRSYEPYKPPSAEALCPFHQERIGGPVAIMNHFLAAGGSDIFSKIDNDVIVPPGWLEAGIEVMRDNPELGLLGIEPPASRTPAPWANGIRQDVPELRTIPGDAIRGYASCDAIGGIGFMRRSAFAGRPAMVPHSFNGVGGFTDWQWQQKDVVKGWIVPPLNVFLLDRMPIEPWVSLSKRYVAEGIQRPWTNYDQKDHALWDWWLDAAA